MSYLSFLDNDVRFKFFFLTSFTYANGSFTSTLCPFLFRDLIKSITFVFLRSLTFSLNVKPKTKILFFLLITLFIYWAKNIGKSLFIFLPERIKFGLTFFFLLNKLNNKDRFQYNDRQLDLVENLKNSILFPLFLKHQKYLYLSF